MADIVPVTGNIADLDPDTWRLETEVIVNYQELLQSYEYCATSMAEPKLYSYASSENHKR